MKHRSHEQTPTGKPYAKRVFATVLTVGWMVVIFLFSAQTGELSGNTSGGIVDWLLHSIYPGYETFSMEKQLAIAEIWHHFIRKAAHFTEYAVLGLLTANALQTYSIRPGYGRFREWYVFCMPSVMKYTSISFPTGPVAFWTCVLIPGEPS